MSGTVVAKRRRMNRCLIFLVCVSLALTACVAGDLSSIEGTVDEPLVRAPYASADLGTLSIALPSSCAPAHDAPAYVRPPNDTVAFASLLEGAGVDPDD